MSVDFSRLTRQDLFDKIVNIKLFSTAKFTASFSAETVTLGDGTVAFASGYVQCPKQGLKPTINVRGQVKPSPQLNSLEVRITNLNTGDIPLDSYKYLRIEAGYATTLSSSIEGEVANVYQETPGPDGVTVFVMLLGYYAQWTNAVATNSFPTNTQLQSVLDYCAGKLGLSLDYQVGRAITIQTAMSFTGPVKDFVVQLASVFGLCIYPDGRFLKAYDPNKSSNKHHVIRYFTNAPKKEAYGYNFTAPWNPDIRPGDVVDIDTRFMRQSYGGAQAQALGSSFVVQLLSFDFSTTDDTNSMTILATAAPA